MVHVPALRFPEFTEEWNYELLDTIAPNITSGKSKPSFGEYNLYGSTGIIGKTATADYSGDMLLVARVGANAGSLQLVNDSCGITDNTLIIKPCKLSSHYLYFYLQHYNLNRLVFGSGQPLITAGMLKKVRIPFGNQLEQKKIENFLCCIEERIATQNKIIEDLKKLKSAIIHRYYSSQMNLVSLSELLKQCSGRNRNRLELQVLSVSNKYGFIAQSDQFEDREVASDDTSNYKIVENGMFAYNPARINVGSIALYEMNGKGIVSPMYVCFATKSELLPNYLKYYFTSQAFRHEMYKRLEGSVRLCLTFEGLCNIEVPLPSIEQQKNIGKNLLKIENKVSLEESVLSQYQLQRRYLLSRMFI